MWIVGRSFCANHKLFRVVWPGFPLPKIRGLSFKSSSNLKHEALLRHNGILNSEACNKTGTFSAPHAWKLKVVYGKGPITIHWRTGIISLRSKSVSHPLCLLETRAPNLQRGDLRTQISGTQIRLKEPIGHSDTRNDRHHDD